MAGVTDTLATKILNATLPVGAAGIPGTWTALSASAMKLRLNSTASTAGTIGTELGSGSGYVTGGTAFANASTASSGGSAVTCPATAAISWTASGTTWSIVSFDITDNAGVRTWFANWNGQPISVADGNTFQVAIGAISVDVS